MGTPAARDVAAVADIAEEAVAVTGPETCTNYHHTRRHLSTNLGPHRGDGTGRSGTALCRPGGVGVDVYDEQAINVVLSLWRRGKPPIVVADLPACRLCARAAARHKAG